MVARKSIARAPMPDAWVISLRTRGAAPANKLEVKLIDRTGRNVWWWRRDAYAFTPDWQPLRIRSSEVEFAWGPAGGGTLKELDALEIAIVAGPGGKGSVWLADLRFEDLSLRAPPRVTASGSAAGHEAAHALDASPDTSWRSPPDARTAWLALDFGAEHEYGGLIVDWGASGAARSFDVECSGDAIEWRQLTSCRQAAGPRSYIYIEGGACSRYLRLHLLEPSADAPLERTYRQSFEIRNLAVQPFDFSRSLADFFHAIAACEPRGHHPRWLHREQSYWTPVGLPGGASAAILNEEGMLEPAPGSFSLEPFLFAAGTLITWADADVSVSLAEQSLPLPSSTWRTGDVELTTTAYAAMAGERRQMRVQYRVANRAAHPQRVRLFVAVRPFQVTPPWQSVDGLGGAARIGSLEWRDGAVVVEDDKRIVPLDPPIGFGAVAFEQGGAMRYIANGELPPQLGVTDAFGHASGVLAWDFALPAAGAAQVELAIAFAPRPALGRVTREPAAAAVADLASAQRYWRHKLDPVQVRLGGTEPESLAVLRTAAAHILVNRDGAALQPGPRRYMRSWIRDSATMAAALLRMGCGSEVRDFLAWYATYQREDGNIPCVVDRRGPDWLPEHDSHGQFVFTLAEYFRFTGDREFVAELWPAARAAIRYLESLRAQRCTDEFRQPERHACFGILPESASHEGYLAQPVHAYWDDFWALRGVADAIELAQALDLGSEAVALRALHEELDRCLYASIRATIAARDLDYVPGSVEWADFDPTATANALAITDAAERLPARALACTFDAYLARARARRSDTDWSNYSAYEIRILGALLRLGRRAEAQELLDFFLSDRRPGAWNQWPEISWRDVRSPGHLGDVPHAWIGAEYVLALLAMFAYERPSDRALVVAAGITDAWLDAGEIAVRNLPTWWGPLSYSMRRAGPDAVRVELASGLSLPPGGIVLRPPLRRPLARVEIDGAPSAAVAAEGVTLRTTAASVLLHC
ncbi:MAG TPA: discoidin domain-containing protein [Burkholderiales bacterium]|nr:discoidin domain-containing protein [Burkholderiales bacterium]